MLDVAKVCNLGFYRIASNMFFSPIQYHEPLFRPPSEARSLIFQVTLGCSWNQCAFCEMYTGKQFRIKPADELIGEIRKAAQAFPATRKVFLADGNAMMLKTTAILSILEAINLHFKRIARVSAYAGARDLARKPVEELIQLKEAGLKLLYVGIESGDNSVLKMVRKGETFESMEKNLLKAKLAGIKLSVMILNGLGGKQFSKQHAQKSAELVSRIQPEFLSTLVLSFPYGLEHFKTRFAGNFIPLDQHELLQEMALFIRQTRLENVVFRSDHASNYLPLKGILGRDKALLLDAIHQVLEGQGRGILREEWERGL